jgi:hypothetical protein
MNKKYPFLFLGLLLTAILIINSCEHNSSRISDREMLIGDWSATSFQVDGQERLNAIFSTIIMQFDAAGSAAWLFTGINDEQESVSGAFEITTGNQNSILRFIDPELSLIISDTLYLTGISETHKEYKIKAIRN